MSEYIVEIPFDNFKQAAIFHGSVDGSRLRSKIELNSNQQIVVEWLKSDDHPNYSNIFDLFSDLLDYQVPVEVGEAFTEMMTDGKQQFQVLQAFAEWGNKSNE